MLRTPGTLDADPPPQEVDAGHHRLKARRSLRIILPLCYDDSCSSRVCTTMPVDVLSSTHPQE